MRLHILNLLRNGEQGVLLRNGEQGVQDLLEET